MATTQTKRPSNGARPPATSPDRERLHEEVTAAALATGRRHVTVAFAIDQILDRMRAQLTRAQRRRFDRQRPAMMAALVVELPPEQQRDYAYERALVDPVRPAELAAYAASHGHHDRPKVPVSIAAAFRVDRALAALPDAVRQRLAGEREALVTQLTKSLTDHYLSASLDAWEPEEMPS